DIDEQRRRRAGQATGRRRLGPPLRVLILDDDDRVPDLDFGVGDGPIRAREAHALGRAEHRTVELQGLPAALNGETGRDPAVRIRDRAGPCCRCHRLPPWWYARHAPGPLRHDAKRIGGSSRPPSTSTTIGGARDPTIPGKRWRSRNTLAGVLAGAGGAPAAGGHIPSLVPGCLWRRNPLGLGGYWLSLPGCFCCSWPALGWRLAPWQARRRAVASLIGRVAALRTSNLTPRRQC